MTGVGQLPCTDTPSPIPRLTSPDAHMSHSLSLSLWEQQHGCLRGPGPEEEKDMLSQLTEGPLPRSAKCPFVSQGTFPGTVPSPRMNPATCPSHTAVSGRLSSLGFKDRKALTGSEGETGVAHIPTAPHMHLLNSLLLPWALL